MGRLPSLDQFPALARWHERQREVPLQSLAAAEWLVFQTCETLVLAPTMERRAARSWADAFSRFVRAAPSPLSDFLAADALVQACGGDFLHIMSQFGEVAIREDAGDGFFLAMQAGAEATSLVALRFLAAWTALNLGKPEACLDECEKVDQPYSYVYTIQGQALIELLRPREAAQALRLAVHLSPREILGWFQLAKAQHLLGDAEEAYKALAECAKIAPGNPEIALFMAMIALGEEGAAPEIVGRAWQELRPHASGHATNADVATALLKLALIRRARGDALTLLPDLDLKHLGRDPQILKSIAPVLRELHDLGWHDVARDLLTGMTAA